MSSTQTTPPFEVSKKRSISMPLTLLVSLLTIVAAGAVAWSSVKDQGDRNAADIKALQSQMGADHDVLVEIHTDVKSLLREKDARK